MYMDLCIAICAVHIKANFNATFAVIPVKAGIQCLISDI